MQQNVQCTCKLSVELAGVVGPACHVGMVKGSGKYRKMLGKNKEKVNYWKKDVEEESDREHLEDLEKLKGNREEMSRYIIKEDCEDYKRCYIDE